MATTINVTSGDGDGGLLRRDREARDAQRYRDLVQRRDARVRGRAEAAQQQPEQVAQYGRSAPAVRRAGLRPAAHRFGGKYGAFQLVCREPASQPPNASYGRWVDPGYATETGRHHTIKFSVLYASRLGGEPIEIPLPDAYFDLQQYYLHTTVDTDVLIYDEFGFDGQTVYLVEVYYLTTGGLDPAGDSRHAWAYLRTVDLLTQGTSVSVSSLGYINNGSFQAGDYPSTGAMLADLLPSSPLHGLYSWTQPTYIGFPPALRPDFGSLVWTNINNDIRKAPLFDAASNSFYDFAPIHDGQFPNSFNVSASLPTISGTQERRESLPIEVSDTWDVVTDDIAMGVPVARTWEPWLQPVVSRYSLTAFNFGKYLSGEVPLPSTGDYCDSNFHYYLSISFRRYAFPLIIPKL